MRAKMTIPKLRDAVMCGRGTGTGDNYLPWLSLTKRDTSPCSNQSYVRMPMLQRHCFFMSRAERHLAHVLWWLGALDVREQFPLWPWPHPHPMAEVTANRVWPGHPGMDEVARQAGIRTYRYPGLCISHVLTIDLMVTVRGPGDAPPRLLGISCKPRALFEQAEPYSRLRERLELDRRYCAEAGIQHLLFHAEDLPVVFVRQIEWLAPLAPRHYVDLVTASSSYQTFVNRFNQIAETVPVHDATKISSRGLRWSNDQTRFALHTALWLQHIDVDLDIPISMASPLHLMGHTMRMVLDDAIFGACT